MPGAQPACDIFLNLSGVWKENQAGNAHLSLNRQIGAAGKRGGRPESLVFGI
jgi:hypothetical protein